jgi:hypothetical protein
MTIRIRKMMRIRSGSTPLLNSLTFGVLGSVELEALSVKGELFLLRHLGGGEKIHRLEEILHLFYPSFTRLELQKFT